MPGMSADSYLSAFSRHLGYPLTVHQWTEALAASVSPIPAALSLARRAGQRASLGVLANNNLLVRDRIDLLFPALRAIFGDSIYVSAQFGLRKPDPEIYRRALAWLGAAPGESLFIDDSAANVAGAMQAGLQGQHHTDAAGLEERLTELGLLS